LKSISHLK